MDGRSHDLGTLLFASLGGYLLGKVDPLLGISFGAGALVGGLFLSPDLDLGYSRPSKRWRFLQVFWAPYRLLHPHRGRSHTYIYGPLSRLAYAVGVGALLLFLVDFLSAHIHLPVYRMGQPPQGVFLEALRWLGERPSLLLGAFMGYMGAQWLHLLMDGISPRGRLW